MRRNVNYFLLPALLAGGIVTGCAKVAVEGGDKPIHIVLDINIRVDQQLDRFFAFEEQIAPTTAPASQSTPDGAGTYNDGQSRGET